MTKFWRLLMASTVLSGLAGLGSAQAGNIAGLPASTDATQAPIVLAQAVAPDDKTKQQQRQDQRQQQRQDNRQNNKQNTQNSPPPPPAGTRSNNNNDNKPSTGNQNNRNQNNTGNNNNNRNNQNTGNNNRNNQNNQNTGNNNRNNNANTGNTTTPTTTQSPPPPPPVTNTQNNNDNNKGNAGNNNRGNANNNNRNNNDNNSNNNNRNNRGNADNNNRNNPGNATTPNQPANNVVRSQDNNKPIVSGGAGKGVAVQTSTGKTVTNVNDLKTERTTAREGNKTVIREADRTIVKEGNKTIIRHDEANRFRVGAVNVSVQKAGADNRTIIVRPGGQKVVTLTDRNGFLLRRSIILPNGREIILINNRPRVGGFFIVLPPPRIRIPRDRYIVAYRDAPPALLYDTLMGPPVDNIERAYSLDEIRYSPTLRDRMPRIDIDSVTFDSGSWELTPDQIDKLGPIADAMNRGIEQNPQVVFLVEGYTDAVGDENDNLSLSDRRAEAVAVALTEQFGVPAENLSTQGYGEQDLKVPTDGPEEANRRVTIRNIAPLLAGKGGQPQQGEPMPQ